MTNAFKRAWREVVRPMVKRPRHLQVAALCYQGTGDKRKFLLITSRDTGRWILPKGWPSDGCNAQESAVLEAWEEAGVTPANVSENAIGSFEYDKRVEGGLPLPVETHVFGIEVDSLAKNFPEKSERNRKWVSPAVAAEMVNEPGLKELLRAV